MNSTGHSGVSNVIFTVTLIVTLFRKWLFKTKRFETKKGSNVCSSTDNFQIKEKPETYSSSMCIIIGTDN